MSHDNVQLARRGYEAMLAGDLAVIRELLDPGVIWHGGDPTDPAACHSRREALAFMAQAQAHGRVGELLDVIGAGDRVVVVTRPPSAGAEPAEPIANLSTFRAGKVIEMVHYPNPDDAVAALRPERADPNTPETLTFAPWGEIPNSTLPVLVYRNTGLDDPTAAERTFAERDWRGSGRDGIFPFHHFHSTAHEVLAIVCGEVTLGLGGPDGQTLTASRGDVLVLPAGTGHCRTSASDDLLVVGAYPGAMEWDVCRGDRAERERVARNLAVVPVPTTDPLHGADGALPRLWRS